MPAKLLSQPHYRQRRQAISKKLSLDSDFLMESEPFEPIFEKPEPVGSPISVAVAFSAPEIQPIALPGAWVVVDRRGKPIKGKMYDEPPKKKPKRKRARKAVREADLFDLEEAPSASNLLMSIEGPKSTPHQNAVRHGLASKHWARYRQRKQETRTAHAALLAAMSEEGLLGDDDLGEYPYPKPLPIKNSPKANSFREKTRRERRRVAAAERCYWPEVTDEWRALEAPPPPKPKLAPRAAKPPRSRPHNDWFPDEQKTPIKDASKAKGAKGAHAYEKVPAKEARAAPPAGKSSKCSLQ